MSVKSAGAVSLLDQMSSELVDLEEEVNAMDALLTMEVLLVDRAARGRATRDVGNLGAAIGKLEAQKDMVFTGGLNTGHGLAKSARKAIQQRVDAAMGTVEAIGARIQASKADPAGRVNSQPKKKQKPKPKLQRQMSIKSEGAVSLLDEMSSELMEFEDQVAKMDELFSAAELSDPAMRGCATRSVGDLGAAISKLEAKKDMVFTGGLESGRGVAKSARKAIQQRVDAAMGTVEAIGARLQVAAAKAALRRAEAGVLMAEAKARAEAEGAPPSWCSIS